MLTVLPMTSQTCVHEKHVHMNKNYFDGTGSPSNKITWISCSVLTDDQAMTSLSFVKHDNELK